MKIEQVRRFALSLPETSESPHFQATSFRVRGKMFATAPPTGESLHVFVDEETRETALALEPGCMEKLFWGGRVWGLRVALATAKPRVVESLLMQAWRNKAPKKLIAGDSTQPIAAKTSARKTPRRAPTR
ncbi:MAG: MmcQ/YjbR family DNA-binding protein [Proteobacteria bacterium]|nr:MmcQ/YjbR family DNA-binding protein [Pseudomonadota bacterium]